MESKVFDTKDPDPNLPTLAEASYKLNHHQAIDFEIDAINKISDFLPQLYPSVPEDEKRNMNKILNILILSKFCHYAENLAAYALSFWVTYDDEKDEMRGVFTTIVKYNMGQIIDFYAHVEKRDESYLAKLLGYPAIILQNQEAAAIFEKSCETIKELLIEIARNYNELYGLYMAYKHGYRIISGQFNAASDIVVYIESHDNKKYIEINKADIEHIRTLSRNCSMILDCIFENHYQRIIHESVGSKSNVEIKTIIKGASIYRKDGYSFLYPTRGQRLKEEELQSDKVYSQLFDDEMEAKNKGKIVAIDFDTKQILHMDYDPKVVISYVHDRETSGRVRLRRVGTNKGTGIKIW